MGNSETGIGLGSLIGGVLAWTVHHSILWMIYGAFWSWFYVGYYLMYH